MAASMQGVIEKLRAQEKELARLHLLAQERAQESERLTEEVTRNMPTGLLLVNATGAISSANPAAEEALGLHPLRYRSYKEILGADSDLTQMLTACLRDGKTFQRGEVEHLTRDGEVRRLGVTISPIYRAARNAGARRRLRDPSDGARDESERRAVPDERLDRTDRAAKTDSLEGKSGGAGRNVRRHRARIQERAGDDFRLRADDPQRSEAGRHARIGGADSRSDARADARGDRISAIREASRNLLRDGADADRGRARGGGTARSCSAMHGRHAKARSSICPATRRCSGRRS